MNDDDSVTMDLNDDIGDDYDDDADDDDDDDADVGDDGDDGDYNYDSFDGYDFYDSDDGYNTVVMTIVMEIIIVKSRNNGDGVDNDELVYITSRLRTVYEFRTKKKYKTV